MPKAATARKEPWEGGSPEEAKESRREAKHAKFKELAEKRTNVALDAIEKIGNLAGPNYVYSQTESGRIVQALRAALDELDAKFEGTVKEQKRFSLP